MNRALRSSKKIKIPRTVPGNRLAINLRERCRQAAASWLSTCQTEREHEIVNGICGDIAVLSLEHLEEK